MVGMKRPPLPRPGIYDQYWYFAAERQAAWERRMAGQPGPWSQDPILQQYKFCNVFRATDRVSQYMIRSVIYHDEPATPEDRLFQIVAFRTFSRPQTWESLRAYLGHYPTLNDLADGSFSQALNHAKQLNGGLYTGAFILCATNAYGQPAKHLNHVELFRQMFLHEELGAWLLGAGSLKAIYDRLHQFPLMGDFMSYQTAIDLNYSQLINFDENEFTQAGPGSLRGLKKAFRDLGDYTPEETISWMVDHQDQEFARLGLPFNGLYGRKLHAIDAQGLFCELDKYCRVAFPDLKSARKRIKAQFAPRAALPELFLPPKWKLRLTNNLIH